jgi:amino acid adenylation domain-containing protein
MTDSFDTVENASTVLALTDWPRPQHTDTDSEMLAAYEQLLREANSVQNTFSHGRFVHQLFEAQVERDPEAIAVSYEQQRLSYTELNSRANQLAHYLQTLDVGPGTLVGICLERSLSLVISILGVLKAGAGYVPLDPAYPAERLAFMLHDAQMSYLLTGNMEKLPEHQALVINLESACESIAQSNTTNPGSSVTSRDVAYVIYTSGSTGLPKGVVIEHYGLCNMLGEQIRLFDLQPHDRIAQFASFSFDASVSEMFITLLVGAQLCLLPQERRWPVSQLQHYLQEYAITTITLPPSVLAVLPPEELPALRTVISAGEELSAEIATRWSTGKKLFNAYGPTEGTVCTTIGLCQVQKRRPSIGYPLNNTYVYLLDALLQPVARGSIGEVYIGGVGVARGYLNRPDLTAEKFLPDPFSSEPGARLYKTGDLARFLPDGSLECIGRTDRMVKIRRFRVELEEVEAVLEQYPRIFQCVVTVYLNSRKARRLAAYVVTRPEYTQNEDYRLLRQEVTSFLQEKLPRYMLPATLVALSAFPLTPNGKIDLRALPTPGLDHQLLRYGKEEK